MSGVDELSDLIARYPELKALAAERDEYKAKLQAYVPHFAGLGDIPPGHFYSPIPSLDDVRKEEGRLFDTTHKSMPGVDLREDEQLRLLQRFAGQYYGDMPFQARKVENLRYYFENPMFSYGDAISLYSMIRHLKPRQIVEVGSGFSSAVALDTNDLFFNGQIQTTFIEPYNERLLSLLNQQDKGKSNIVESLVQDVDLDVFSSLDENDILFVDSTHVSKIGSDVNRLFFEVLPSLAKGVYVHFHDIFLPFEYPPQWIYEGRAWNEAYVLRAFMQYNQTFEVVLMNAFMGMRHGDFLREKMPLFMNNTGGSFWIRKTE
ncbi:class I SAM-dependent methyltransferase [Paraburkholderia strydomiana]|uniref:class I SAM-dependent methyltransferase n=1 Tax=Paraburkholderia strydomiana TaxID=1245417 RepID=UPI001BEAC7FF|nr:class I SAM-dependent methyltransferase [Paraburkholderia strydomiana]MBT2790446.1 class I SAM-dependent methyltransferase [Paraburkholderia strydomiana]